MPSLLTVLRDPSSRRPDPEPLAVDLFRVIAVGTAIWGAVLLGAVVVHLTTATDAARWVQVACAGLALGGIGLAWSARNRKRWQSERG
ncbi:MAG: DUF2530 domain-containing protein [Actinomycetales bacterium]|nr:DUF2530 domain-containing protein [Actinomycetales bacterium]